MNTSSPTPATIDRWRGTVDRLAVISEQLVDESVEIRRRTPPGEQLPDEDRAAIRELHARARRAIGRCQVLLRKILAAERDEIDREMRETFGSTS